MKTQPRHSAVRSRNDGGRRGRAGTGMLLACVMASSGMAGLLTAAPASAVVPTFPDNLVVFPDRDFVVVENFQTHVGQLATVEVTRAGAGVVGSAQSLVAAGDVAFEINHPGGICWGNGTGLNVTPDIQAGDVVSISFAGTKVSDTTVQDAAVTADSVLVGSTLTITGHVGASVNTAQMEQRIVNPDLTETAVARRDVRAVPGPLTRAPKGGYSSSLEFAGETFTATYVFDDAGVAQIAAAGGGERAMAWQEEDVDANRQGLTIAEYGELGGPGMGGCPNGPLQSGPPGPTNVLAANVTGGVKLTWTPAVAIPGTAAITGYRATAIDQTPTASGELVEIGRRIGDPAATGTTITGLSSTGTYEIEVVSLSSVGQTFPAVPAHPVTDTTPPTVSASLAGGSYPVAQQVTLSADEPGSQIFYTTDGTDPVDSVGFQTTTATFYTDPIAISADTTLKFVAFDPSGNVSPIVEQVYTITNTPTPAAPSFTSTSAGAGSVTLSWADSGSSDPSITGYGVQVYDGAGTAKIGALRPTTVKTMTITDLTVDTPYRFTVVAINANGSSPESPMVGPLTPLGPVVANAGPDQVVVRGTSATQVTLTGAGSSGDTYAWSQVLAGPADPDLVTLTDPATLSPSFILPLYEYPMTNKPLAFRLTVTTAGNVRTDEVLVTPRPDQVSISSSKWKSGDFRVTGAGSVVGATITVHEGSLDGPERGRTSVTAAAAPDTGGIFSLRLRDAAAGTGSPGTIWIESTVGGTAGPFTVGR